MLFLSRVIFSAGLLLFTLFNSGESVEIQIESVEITHKFGDGIYFNLKTVPSKNLQSARVYVQSEDKKINVSSPLILSRPGQMNGVVDLNQLHFSPFSTLSIWFEFDLIDGSNNLSKLHQYFYDDNRYEWKTIKTDEFVISWYQDNPDLGGKILKAANEGLIRIQSLINVPNPKDIQIYVYSNTTDMHQALTYSDNSTTWVAGHTTPDQKVVMVSIQTGVDQESEIQRQIPHELTHVLIYEKVGEEYTNLPRWLNEGLASTAEINPSPQYQEILTKASDSKSLIPLEDLCISFPQDSPNIQLSYAESYSFVSFLQKKYGKEKIEELILSYSSNESCTEGIRNTFNTPLTELEADWKQDTFNIIPFAILVKQSMPLFIIVIIAFLVPILMVGILLVKAKKERNGNFNNL
jgi:hypothetical protein